MSEYILRAKDIYKTYRMGAVNLEVLKGVDLSVGSGEFVAIIGASGSGKSTLLHILGALDKPDKGEVEFDGRTVTSISNGKLNKYRNSTVGFVFQFYHLLDELTVLENVLLPAMISSSVISWLARRNTAKKYAMELLERLGLVHRLAHKPYQLSGGERQRAAIGRALMNKPPLLLADEPTGNLDSATGNGILNIFEELNKAGQTVVMVTHDPRIAARANRTVRLADGIVARASCP
jgi:lipoprotein-releasing system ATP-binding protein